MSRSVKSPTAKFIKDRSFKEILLEKRFDNVYSLSGHPSEIKLPVHQYGMTASRSQIVNILV